MFSLRVQSLLLILEPLLGLFCVIAALTVIYRLHRLALLKKYWPLVVFLVADVLEIAAVLTFSVTQAFQVYRLGDLAKLVASIALIWTLAQSVFARFPAIASFASKSSKLIVALSLLLGWISFLTDSIPPAGRSPELHLWISLDRAVTTGLLAFMVAMTVFASWFPVQMARNLGRILAGFLLWLSISWMSYLASNRAATSIGNAAYNAVVLGILVYWISTINAAGETDSSGTLPKWDPDRLNQVTAQLTQMEAQLARRGY